jgi:hypothetical protein
MISMDIGQVQESQSVTADHGSTYVPSGNGHGTEREASFPNHFGNSSRRNT